MRWNNARLCSRLVVASNIRVAFFLPFFPGTTHENCNAMIALRMSPLEDSTTISNASFDGARLEDLDLEAEAK